MRTRAMWLAVVTFAVAAAGCSEPNPRSCADGLCSDPNRPFCDADGALEGTPGVCVPVSCTQGEFIACRNDEVIRCNASGNNYELLACQRGCSEPERGCISCSVDAECSNPAPICDTMAHDCRGCRSDGECPSTVCALDTGACVAEAAVVYASPGGTPSGAGTTADPASIARAITLVTSSASNKTLRLLPGIYASQFDVQGVVTVNAVATGAVLGPSSGFFARGGATVEVRGIEVRSATNSGTGGREIVCGDATATIPKSSLTFRDSVLAVNAPSTVLNATRCNLRIEQTTIEAINVAISLNDDCSFEGDRLYIRNALGQSSVNSSGLRNSIRVTNSVFENAYASASNADTIAPGSRAYFAFNTFVFTRQDGGQACDYSTSYVRDIRFENNIFYATNSANATYGADWTHCGLSNNVLFPQADARIGNVVADPKFVDLAAKNYGLQATSPALNAAVPSTGLSTDHDYDGVARPQGAAPDIGAFERTP